jgi:dolichol kinase
MFSIPRDEIKRKMFHLLSLTYVFVYKYSPKITAICGLFIAILIVGLFEFMRFSIPSFNDFFKDNFKGFYRPDEADKISGLIWTLSGALLVILIFHNKSIIFASLLYFSLGDAVAALVGRSFGKHKLFAGKSLEGSLACFVMCFIIGLFLFNWRFAFIGAVVAAFVELISCKLNDNFLMQLLNACLLTVLSNIMLWTK